jgi:hypothetical protein
MWYEVGRQENVLLVAVAALIASAIFLLPLKGSSSRYWRVADLAILAVGAFGLFAASFESDDEISNRFLALQYSPEAIKSTWVTAHPRHRNPVLDNAGSPIDTRFMG